MENSSTVKTGSQHIWAQMADVELGMYCSDGFLFFFFFLANKNQRSLSLKKNRIKDVGNFRMRLKHENITEKAKTLSIYWMMTGQDEWTT